MAVLLIALLVVLLLGGLGFALHVLWWLALIALVSGYWALYSGSARVPDAGITGSR